MNERTYLHTLYAVASVLALLIVCQTIKSVAATSSFRTATQFLQAK